MKDCVVDVMVDSKLLPGKTSNESWPTLGNAKGKSDDDKVE